MAFDFSTFLQSTAPIIGAGAGAGIQRARGGDLVSGMEIGAAGGLALSQGLKMFQDLPEQMGATGEQQAILAAQLGGLERAGEQRGLTAQSIQAMGVASQQARREQLQQQALLGQQLSPLEAEAMTRGLAERMQQQQIDLETRVAAMDEKAQAIRISELATMTQTAQANAENIRKAEQAAKERAEAAEAARLRNFNTSMVGLTQSVATSIKAANLIEAQEAAKAAKDKAASAAKRKKMEDIEIPVKELRDKRIEVEKAQEEEDKKQRSLDIEASLESLEGGLTWYFDEEELLDYLKIDSLVNGG